MDSEIKKLLIKYVEMNSKAHNLDWDPNISEKLLFDPYDKSHSGRKETLHYFLLVAAITESRLIGRAENARAIMIHLQTKLNGDLFRIQKIDRLQELLFDSPFYEDLGPEKDNIPETIASVNKFVNDIAENDLFRYSEKFQKPIEMVQGMAQGIHRMAGVYSEKPWMYLQWMTRPYPDLGILQHFSLKDLYVPVTSYIRDVAYCLGLCNEPNSKKWDDLEYRDKARESVTTFAKELFPEDPSKVNYPFYLLGRWIRGKKLSLQLLHNYLHFFEELNNKTHTVPVTYDIVSRNMSSFEENVKAELQKTRLMFYFESLRFNLPGGITYLPDFVLPEPKIGGKTVLLEPHGVWSYPQVRTFKIGGRVMKVQAYGADIDRTELLFTQKLRLFRKTFGRDFYLILLVPARVFDRVKLLYHESYDELYEGADIPELLYRLTRSST